MNNIRPRQVHPYHLVDLSPWPLFMSMAILSAALTIVSWLGGLTPSNIVPQLVIIVFIAILWWRDVLREAKGGKHTTIVQRGFVIGFLLFILSEIMLFVSFFWAYFNSSLSPGVELGCGWPPVGINAVDPWSIPLLGTCVLLASGFILTLSHHAIVMGKKDLALISLLLTIVLGIFFLYLQINEYYYCSFTFADSVYGSIFFMVTGLHGLHVLVGVLFLIVAFFRIFLDHLTTERAINLDFAVYYWHFVDIVWLFVFLLFYYWGGSSV